MEPHARHGDHRAVHHELRVEDLIRRTARCVLAALADAVWPPACPICGGPLGRDESVCGECAGRAGLLAGPRCPRCSAPVPSDVPSCSACATLPAGIAARIIAAEYAVARPWIFAFKYDGDRALGLVLADWLARAVARSEWAGSIDAVVPVPIHRRRLRGRGFNQAEVLAEAVAEALRVPCRRDALVRLRDTPQQTHLDDRRRRIANVAGAFAVAARDAIAGRRVLVVDDVITTGATVAACAEALLGAGARQVTAAAVAHPFHVAPHEPIDVAACDI